MADNTKQEYKFLGGDRVRCTARKTRAVEGGIQRIFDVTLDFTGVSEDQVKEWAAATAFIRVQGGWRKRKDAEAFLAKCEREFNATGAPILVRLKDMGGKLSLEEQLAQMGEEERMRLIAKYLKPAATEPEEGSEEEEIEA